MSSFPWRKLISSGSGSTTTRLSNRLVRQKRAATGSTRAKRRTILELEPLETRMVPAVTAVQTGGVLNVTIGASGDTAEIYGTCTTSTVGDVTVNGTGFTRTSYTGVTNINVNSTASGGTVEFDDNLSGNSAVDLGTTAGNDIFVNAAAVLLITRSGSGSTTLIAGGFNQTAATSVNLANDMNTGSDGIIFSNAVRVFRIAETLTSTGTVTFASTVDDFLANSQNLTVNSAVVFDGQVGVTNPLKVLTVNGCSTLNATNFNTCSTQTYNGPVLLEQNVSLSAMCSTTPQIVTFGNTVDSFNGTHHSLAVKGNAVFNGDVGNSNAVATLTVNNGTTFNTANVSTDSNQAYNGPVSVRANVVLNANSTNVAFGNTINSNTATPESLNVTSGNAIFNGNVGSTNRLSTLTVGNETFLNAATFNTCSTQNYNGPVFLETGVTLNANNGTNVTFGNTVDSNGVSQENLTVSGNAIFNGNVGAAHQLLNLTVANATTVNAPNFCTVGYQSYNGAVSINSTVTFRSTGAGGTGNITFGDTLDGGDSVTVDTTSAATFCKAVGGGTPLSSLTVQHGAGTANFNGSVTTTGAQIYNETAINVTNTVVFNSTTNGGVSFCGALNGGNAVTVDTTGADATFCNAVGNSTALSTLTVNGGNVAVLSGNVTTSGAQTYNEAVNLTGNATLTGTTVTFDGTVSGPGDHLTVNGATAINAASVNTSGANQTYCGTVTLLTGTTLTGNTIAFDGNVSGTNQSLTVDGATQFAANAVTTTNATQNYNGTLLLLSNATLTGSTVTFGGNVTTATNTSLTVNGVADIDTSSVTTQGAITGTSNQTYCGAVNLGCSTQLDGNTITFDGPVNASGPSLTLNDLTTDINTNSINTVGGNQTYCGAVNLGCTATLTGNAVTFFGDVSGASAGLTVDGITEMFAASINTGSNAQTYNGPVILADDVTLTANTVTFLGNVSILNGSTGGLTVEGVTDIKTAAINTGNGVQAYNGPVNLDADATLTGNTITFDGDIALGALTLILDGNASLNSADTLSVSLVNATVNGEIDVASGSINLASANLNVTSSFTYAAHSTVTLVNVSSGAAESGTFNGLPQGSQVVVGSNDFTISYSGGSGSNIVLTTPAAPTGTPTAPTGTPAAPTGTSSSSASLPASVALLYLTEDRFVWTVDSIVSLITHDSVFTTLADRVLSLFNDLLFHVDNPALGTGVEGLQSALNANPYYGTPWGLLAQALGFEIAVNLFAQ